MSDDQSAPSRRNFLKNIALATAGGTSVLGEAQQPGRTTARRPNVLMVCADQFRADFIGAAKQNPSVHTPNLDSIARRGVMCTNAVCNQPLCSPSRASFLTSRHATETGVWKLGLEMDHRIPTIADLFNDNGYSTHFVGKWHVSSNRKSDGSPNLGWIPPGTSRGGFKTWEGANVTELISHPYEGSYWDNEGRDLKYKDRYRVEFMTDRAIQLIEQQRRGPWMLFLSILEPHQQNDVDQFVAPNGYTEKYLNPHVPLDLRQLEGNWQDHLPGYYGCVQSIDEAMGRIVASLAKQNLLDDTIIAFFSDHGCHFRTRIGEYKRSPHDSSLRVPFLLQGPGLDYSTELAQQVTLLDLAPTLLDAAGIKPPQSMRGRSILPLLTEADARSKWDDEPAFIQISASMCARAIRTREWCYCVYDPNANGDQVPSSTNYTEWALYSLSGDPAQLRNLAGRPEYKEVSARLRTELKRLIVAAGEQEPTIHPAPTFN